MWQVATEVKRGICIGGNGTMTGTGDVAIPENHLRIGKRFGSGLLGIALAGEEVHPCAAGEKEQKEPDKSVGLHNVCNVFN